MYGWMDGRTEGRLEIHPFVLQDIGPLGPLPKKGEEGILIIIISDEPPQFKNIFPG